MALDIGIIVTAVNNARNSLKQAHADVDKLGEKGQAAANKLRAIHVVLAGIATGGLAAFSKKIVDTTGDLEALIFRLGVLEGGLLGAKERFAELIKTFGNAPVALDAVVDSFVRLRAAGLNSIDAMSTVKAAVDAVAAFGGGTEELKRLSIGLQQVLGKGVLQMEELRQQIGEAVPSAMRILAREMGISVAELVHRVGKGTVDAQTAVTKLRIGFEKDFGGIAQAIGSTTIKGALAQFTTNVKAAVAQAFIFDTTANVRVAALIRDTGEAIARLIKSVDNDTVSKFFNLLTDIGNVAVRVGQALGPIVGLILEIASAIGRMLAAIPSNVLQAGVIAAILLGIGGLFGGGAAIVGLIGLIISKLDAVGVNVKNLMTTWGDAIAAGGIIAWLLFGKGGAIGKIVASFILVFSQLDTFTDRIHAIGISIQALSKGEFIAPGTIFKTAQDFRANGIEGVDRAKITAEATGSETAAAYLRGVYDHLKSAGPNSDAFKKRAEMDFKKMQEAYASAMKVSEAGRTPAGLSILGQKGVEELEGLERRLSIALQEGGGRKEMARLLQNLDEVNKKFATSRERLEELRQSRGTRDFTEAQKAELGELEQSFTFIDRRLEDFRRNAAKVKSAAVGASVEQIDLTFRKLVLSVKDLKAEFTGDELTKQIADIDKKFGDVGLRIEAVAIRYRKLGDTTGLAATKALLDDHNETHRKTIALLKERFQIEQSIFQLEQARVQQDIASQVRLLERDQRSGLARAFSSRFVDEAADRRAQLTQQLTDVQIKIAQLNKELLDPKLSDDQRNSVERTREAYARLQEQIASNIDATTAFALQTRELWDGVGKAIESSLKDALKGFIKGTKDAEAVLLAFYDKITDAAIDYLFEVTKILLKQQLLGATTGGTGGGVLGFLGGLFGGGSPGGGGFALGGAFRGGIKPFAKGGLIGGPTLFGLAGEAGKEAILPLDNVGGKLGVRASGGSGETHVHFHGVIDAESFFAKNRSHIVGTIQQARKQNRSGGI